MSEVFYPYNQELISLNDQDVRFNVAIYADTLYFEFDSKIKFLKNMIKVEKGDNGEYFAKIGLKRFLRVTKNEITLLRKVTSTEIRLLRAIYNRIIARNKEREKEVKSAIIHHRPLSDNIISEIVNPESIEAFLDEASKVGSIYKKEWTDKQIGNTELHTHLIEILNGREFLNFINSYHIEMPLDENERLDFDGGTLSSPNTAAASEIYKDLVLELDGQYTFGDLEKKISNRRNLLNIVIDKKAEELKTDDKVKKYIEEKAKEYNEEINILSNKYKNKEIKRKEYGEKLNNLKAKIKELKLYPNTLASNMIYNELLSKCLDKLEKEKIDYSEISFSNLNRLEYMSDNHKDDQRFNLLLSINRNNKIQSYAKTADKLEGLLNKDKVVGVDIMGHETPITYSNKGDYEDKLEWIIPVLHLHPNSVLRLHASEFKDCTENLYYTLLAIKNVSKRLNDKYKELFGRKWGKIPPPRIRIGHGVNILKNKDLVNLIKEFDAVIEINVSSNYALGHISSIDDVPLDFYKKNHIKYTISTDGGGMYSTSILQEENLLNNLDVRNGGRPLKKSKFNPIKKEKLDPKKEEQLRKFMDYKRSEKVKEKSYECFEDAVRSEMIKTGAQDGREVINNEIMKMEIYVMDHGLENKKEFYERNFARLKFLSKDMADENYVKTYLYLLEKEVFPEMESYLESIKYLESLSKVKKDIISEEDRERYNRFLDYKNRYDESNFEYKGKIIK